jgi:hypothetical protein
MTKMGLATGFFLQTHLVTLLPVSELIADCRFNYKADNFFFSAISGRILVTVVFH